MTRDEFFAAVCQRFGWAATPWRLAVFANWAQQEGMPFDLTYNPLATTRLSSHTALNTSFDQGFGPGNWNSVPVRVYATAADGIQATVETLELDYYPWIRKCFTDERGYPGAVDEFETYVGSRAYGQRVVTFMDTTDAAREEDMPDPRIDEIIANQHEITQALTGLSDPAAALSRIKAWNDMIQPDGTNTDASALDSILSLERAHPGDPGDPHAHTHPVSVGPGVSV